MAFLDRLCCNVLHISVNLTDPDDPCDPYDEKIDN